MPTTVRGWIEIDRTPAEVSRVLFDQAKMTEWTSDLESVTLVRGQPGEVGSVARLRYVQDGKPYEMMDELLEHEPERRILSRVTGEALSAEIETRLIPVPSGTRLELRWRGSGRSFPFRFLLPFLRRAIARQMANDLSKLKQVVEAGSP